MLQQVDMVLLTGFLALCANPPPTWPLFSRFYSADTHCAQLLLLICINTYTLYAAPY